MARIALQGGKRTPMRCRAVPRRKSLDSQQDIAARQDGVYYGMSCTRSTATQSSFFIVYSDLLSVCAHF